MRQGVHYAGRSRHSAGAATAAVGLPAFFSRTDAPATRLWDVLRHEIVSSTAPRVVLSSEFFADADEKGIASLLADVARPHVHVVITLRPVARIVPSHWQQTIQSGNSWSFESWLHAMLDPDGDRSINPTFWHRHQHDALVRRWASVAGEQNVTVVVLDSRDPGFALRAFEGLTGLAEGTLVAPDELSNRSLTWDEVEALRALNAQLIDAKLGLNSRRRLSHSGAAHYLKQFPPDPTHQRIDVPLWARPVLTRVADGIVEGLAGSGTRLVGDLALLAPALSDDDPGLVDDPPVSAQLAGRLAAGALGGAGALTWDALGVEDSTVLPLFATTPTPELGRIAMARARDKARRVVRRSRVYVRLPRR
jgi:hypothetical protein